ncbi:MAG: beta-ketoacyl-ACP synthase II [Coriobacteriales bacterium]|nr:beta-ketoacyl-ACP synthase II [Coriobacteriales bacterium]
MRAKNGTVHRVVITGMGAVTPLGNDVRTFRDGIRSGRCGIGPITLYDPTAQAAKLAAETDINLEEHLSKADLRKMDRFTALALVAAREAFIDSGISETNTDLTRVDTLISSGIGGLGTTIREHTRALERGFDRVSPYYIPVTIPNMAAGRVAIEFGLKGDCSCVVTACASSSHAIGEAMRHIRHGYADAALCGGAEACVLPMSMGGFTSMQALHTGSDPKRASIPFDRERSGFILGEGAGILILESLEHAQARGATIHAEVTGLGATCDAYHMTAPDPSSNGAIRAIRAALKDAGLEPADIDYINAHGTSTPLNDKGETLAIHTVFGEKTTIPVSSTKSMTGHLLGAAGGVEAIVCALAVRDGFIPPTINYRVPDPECALDVVPNTARIGVTVQHAVSNSLGFGGHNAALVLSHYE